jgi:tRNA A-37 threonylcarbamoyl transferase component Bud32
MQQRRVLDAALVALLNQPTGPTSVPLIELRYAIRDQNRDLIEKIIASCVPTLFSRQDDNFTLTLDGLLASSDSRPEIALRAMLDLIERRYHAPDGRRQRSVTWSDVRQRSELKAADFTVTWLTHQFAHLGVCGTTVQGADRDHSSPRFDYNFPLHENELEAMAENATVENWAAYRRKRLETGTTHVPSEMANQPSTELTPTAALAGVVEEMKNLMIKIATGDRAYEDKDTADSYLRLRKGLFRYDRLIAPPEVVRAASDARDFWTFVTNGRGSYAGRRTFIQESFTRYYNDSLVQGGQPDLALFLQARDLVLGTKVGGGGSGDVFRAEHSILGPRAVKLFRPHFYDGNSEALQRFNREAKLLDRLSHPGIVRFFDAGVAPGFAPFIITEFIEGDSLEAQLKKQSKIEPVETIAICKQVLDALGSAHRIGIIHRDIKPNNIMWTNDKATLLDLGSGGIMSDVLTTRITKDAQGTMGYMAPELIDDSTLLDPRTDVYSVGVLLHRLLTGRALQPGKPGYYLEKENGPSGVLEVIQRAVAPAEERYRTSQEMADALGELPAAIADGHPE